MAKNLLIVATEPSADLHAAEVLRAYRDAGYEHEPWGIGGPHMRQYGFEALVQSENMGVAGLTEVIPALPRLYGYFRSILKTAKVRRPHVALLVDAPDFNLPLAKRLKKMGIPVIYYISPQLWAWRRGRVKQVQRYVDTMLVILPFEESFYRGHGVIAQFVGHPLVEELAHLPKRETLATQGIPSGEQKTITLMPGSRGQEIRRHLVPILQAASLLKAKWPQTRFLLPIASLTQKPLIEAELARQQVDAEIIVGNASQALLASDAAVVCSGTATLQGAILGTPMVVVYKLSWLSFMLLRRLVKTAFISLVNLIAEKQVVPELLQKQLTPQAVAHEINKLLEDPKARQQQIGAMLKIKTKLGESQSAPQVVEHIGRWLK